MFSEVGKVIKFAQEKTTAYVRIDTILWPLKNVFGVFFIFSIFATNIIL